MTELPYEGEYFRSPKKIRDETVVLVHFWGGRKTHLKRHIELVNQLGFDAVAFNLSYHPRWMLTRIPLSRSGKLGLKHVWADEVEAILNAVPGKKILYCFSNPTSCTIEALVRRNCVDVLGLIGDCGPFVHLQQCNSNMFSLDFGPKYWLIAPLTAAILGFFWSPDHDKSLRSDLAALPMGFPFLSIRSGKDRMVGLHCISDAFDGINQLDLEVLVIPEADHLTGLRDHESIYRPVVENWLLSKLGPAVATQDSKE